MKKSIYIFILLLLIICATTASAQDVVFTASYPSPLTSFKNLRLFPQNTSATLNALGSSCSYPGTIYFNKDDDTYYSCNPYSDTWEFVPGVWTQEGDNVFLSDTENPSDSSTWKTITITPLTDEDGYPITPFKLSLGNNAGIIAKGTFDDGTNNVLITTPAPGKTRFIWFPEKASFTTGGIPLPGFKIETSTDISNVRNNWNESNIGDYSTNFGIANKAAAAASSILGGVNNKIESGSNHSTIIGGSLNTTTNSPFSVSGGRKTSIDNSPYSVNFGFKSTIQGGESNVVILGPSTIINNSFCFIGGSAGGQATIGNDPQTNSADYAAILNADALINTDDTITFPPGPLSNNASHSFIGTGEGHEIQGYSPASTIAGGKDNKILSAKHSVILAGENNTVSGHTNSIADYPGDPCLINCYDLSIEHGSIGGGELNRVLSDFSTILGGKNNVAGGWRDLVSNLPVPPLFISHATHAAISGGRYNKAFGKFSFIGGGRNNRIGSCWDRNEDNNTDCNDTYNDFTQAPDEPFIADPNKDDGQYSTIGAGKDNTILANYAFIGSGENNTIDTGGDYSSIPSGKNVYIDGTHSWASGRNINVTGDNVWIWGYKSDEDALTNNADPSDDAPIEITQSNVFIFYNVANPVLGIEPIRVGIRTANPNPLFALDVNGDIQAKSLIISTIGPQTGNLGNGCINGTEVVKCDIAEIFEAVEEVSPGDVLVIDPTAATLKLKKSSSAYDKKVVGIVSRSPAITFEGNQLVGHAEITEKTFRPPVALAGRVKCKVSLENGSIQKGDLLTTSSLAGHAMKVQDPRKAFGKIIGKALESFNESISNGEKTGEIIVFVALQ